MISVTLYHTFFRAKQHNSQIKAILRLNQIIWMPFLFDLVNRDRFPVKFIALMNLCFGCQHIKWT